MELSDVLRSRFSVRAYRSDPVDDAILERVLEAALLAPTADNRQPFRLIVIRTRGRETELRRVYHREWFVTAPIVIAACAVPDECWVRKSDGKRYADVDVAIVMDHLILAATAAGLGTCWVAAFDPVAAREVLGLPAGVEPIVFTPLGWPADTPRPKQRKSRVDRVCDERYTW